jgi:outer membrane lipoprotein LolB
VIRRALWPLLATALLAACAATPPAPGEPRWISGRLSVRIAANAAQSAQSLSAAFELRGDADSGELRLNSPLGARMASVSWSPGLALLDTPDGGQRYDSLDELARQALGEPLPLAALPDWLTGRPWARAPHRRLDDGFEQLGWQVVLARHSEGWIEARRAAPPTVLLRIRLDNPQP